MSKPRATKRQSTDSPDSSPPSSKRQRQRKRQRKSQNRNEDSLICSITHELPLDPVTAEDGHIYERTAIEDYFKSKGDGKPITSPITRQVMGTKLLPSPRIKSHIETMIDNGAITGPPADDWKKRVKEKKQMEALLKKAEEGDVNAMEIVAKAYDIGIYGFQKDWKEAFIWYGRAHVAGSVYGMAKVGECLINGFCRFGGVEKDMAKGMMYLGMAAGQGSDLAAYILGSYMADGLCGVPVDKVLARKFLEKCLTGNCLHKNMSDKDKQDAQEKLDQLVDENA